MNENELKQAYFELIKDYLNNFHEIEKIEDAPRPIRLAVDKLIEYGNRDSTVSSEGIADLKVTYFETDGMPKDILALLGPYKRLGW